MARQARRASSDEAARAAGSWPGADTSSAASRGAWGWRARRRCSLASALRAIWKSHTRKVLTRPVAALLERGQPAERLQEDLLGHVFGRVVVTQFISGKAVYLPHVLAVERLEPARIAPGRLDGRAIGVERDEALAASFRCFPEHRRSLAVTGAAFASVRGSAVRAWCDRRCYRADGSSSGPSLVLGSSAVFDAIHAWYERLRRRLRPRRAMGEGRPRVRHRRRRHHHLRHHHVPAGLRRPEARAS